MAREWRVYGPPGTGKTTFLSRQAVRAAEKYRPGDVVIASLTRAAAEEVAGRRTGIPQRNVSTLHAHAYRALEHPKVADVPDGFEEWNEFIGPHAPRLKIKTSLASDMDAPPAEAWGYATDGEVLLAEYGILRNRMTPRELWTLRLRKFADSWEQWKYESGRIDFTDMIEKAYDIAPTLPDDPSVFMLDEAQDMSGLEMRLARKWGEACDDFVIVGDPDQNLYEWRGSDPGAFTSAEAEREQVLSQSYRVPRAVHAYATAWIEKIAGRAPVKYEPRDADGSAELTRASWARPEQIVREAEAAAERGETSMVLASCGYMLGPVVRMLRERGTPFHNPYRTKNGAWNPMRAAYRVLAFLKQDPATFPEGATGWTWDDLRIWTEPLLAKGVVIRGGKVLIDRNCQKDRFGESKKDEEVGLFDSLDLFEKENFQALMTADLDWWESKLRTKRKGVYLYPLDVARKHGRPALRETPKIVVGTIHSVKGGEADNVYVFPDLSRRGAEEFRTAAGRAATIRQFYVAFTRAREHLHICLPDTAWYVRLPNPA